MADIGYIDSVTIDENRRRVFVTVFVGIGRTERNIPFRMPASGIWAVPREGQAVEVYEAARGRKAARLPYSAPDYDMPSGLQEGDFALTTDSGTAILVKANGNIDIDASGDINIDAQGDVFVDGIDFDAHTHDYDDDNGTSTTTKTTQAPN